MENINWVDKLKESSSNQSSDDNAYTRCPIFVVQDLKFVARVNEDIYEESSNSEGEEVYLYEYFTEESSKTAKQAIEDVEQALEEAVQEGYSELLDVVDTFPDYKTDSRDLRWIWDVTPGNNGSGLCKYMYVDQSWFLTRQAAEEHIKRSKHNYNKPRIYVKSLIHTGFEKLFKELGFKHYQ